MLTTESRAEREARYQTEKAAAFDRFMAKPETKLLASLVPASEPPEALTTLLRAAFDAGNSEGAASVLQEMLTAMLKSKPDGSA